MNKNNCLIDKMIERSDEQLEKNRDALRLKGKGNDFLYDFYTHIFQSCIAPVSFTPTLLRMIVLVMLGE
jgi:hypothetical protein